MGNPEPLDNFEKTEFNSQLATLIRIDEIKKSLHRATEKDDLLGRCRMLFAFFRELAPVFKKSHYNEHFEKYCYMHRQYISLKRGLSKGKTLKFNPLILDRWELELRKLEQEYGMNMKKGKDSRFALSSK